MNDYDFSSLSGIPDSFEESLVAITENPPVSGKRNVQKLAMNLVIADPDLFQARTGLNEGGLNDYRFELEEGGKFPPMIVFCDPAKYEFYLVDGYHRWTLYKEKQYRWHFFHVIFGTKAQAIEYAVSANVGKHGIKLNDQDKKKACFMLYSLPGWLDASSTVVAKKVGAASATVLNWKNEYCLLKKIDRPSEIVTSDGSRRCSKSKRMVLTVQDAIDGIRGPDLKRDGKYAIFKGKHREALSSDLNESKRMAESLFHDGFFDAKPGVRGVSLESTTAVKNWLTRQGVMVSPRRAGRRPTVTFDDQAFEQLVDYWIDDVPVRVAHNITQQSFTGFFGDVELARRKSGATIGVILCYAPSECLFLCDYLRSIGIYCMKPQEFVEFYKSRKIA